VGWRHYLFLVAVAGIVTAAATPLVRILSLRWGITAKPGGRNVHTGEISRLGGVAMFLGFLAALIAEWVAEMWFGVGGDALLKGDGPLFGFLIGLLVIFATGVIDDILSLSPAAKLAGQVLAAGVVVYFGLRVDFVANPFAGGGLQSLGLLGIPVTLVWIVGFTNVINLIDGLDGLAAGVTMIATISFLVLAHQQNQLVAAAISCALIGCCAGFLRYNFNPASIFMGDSGAMFLGFTLGCLALLGVMKSVAAITLAVPLLIIGVPIFDTATAIIRRVRHQRPIQEADNGHIHHRLLGRGFNQRQTVLIIYVWSAMLAVGGYAMRWAPGPYRIASFALLAVLSGFMASWLGLFEAAHYRAEDD
jgi:UDP-GlcNAc:undecaprenyl-phosphate GlcNAc-1-phosphate transferase